MGRDRLVDEIARAMARAENASEDHFEAYRHVAEAVAAVVEPLLAEKDAAEAALAELVRLKDGPRDAAYEEAKPYAWAQARLVLSEASPVSLDEPAVSEVGSTGVVSSEGADQLASPCSHCDGHGLMQTGYTGTLQYCGECNACDGSGTVPVVTDEERAALRSACSKCGGLVRLELRCEACGDMPAGSLTENEGELDQLERQAFDRGFAEGVIHTDGGGCTCVQVGPVVTVAPDCQLHGFAFEGFVLVGVELPVSWPRVSEEDNQ